MHAADRPRDRGIRMKHAQIKLDAIQVGERFRSDIDQATVDDLVTSIGKLGLQNPISVFYKSADDGGKETVPILVAGRHGLEAMRRIGGDHIDCVVFEDENSAELWQVSENLHRSDLTIDQRAEHRTRWMRLMGILTDDGEVLLGQVDQSVLADGRAAGPQHQQRGIAQAAREMPGLKGKSDEAKRSQVRRDVAITKRTPEAKAECVALGLDNNQQALLEVAKASPEKQVETARAVAARKATRPVKSASKKGLVAKSAKPTDTTVQEVSHAPTEAHDDDAETPKAPAPSAAAPSVDLPRLVAAADAALAALRTPQQWADVAGRHPSEWRAAMVKIGVATPPSVAATALDSTRRVAAAHAALRALSGPAEWDDVATLNTEEWVAAARSLDEPAGAIPVFPTVARAA